MHAPLKKIKKYKLEFKENHELVLVYEDLS